MRNYVDKQKNSGSDLCSTIYQTSTQHALLVPLLQAPTEGWARLGGKQEQDS
jgi:hypothetical protein